AGDRGRAVEGRGDGEGGGRRARQSGERERHRVDADRRHDDLLTAGEVGGAGGDGSAATDGRAPGHGARAGAVRNRGINGGWHATRSASWHAGARPERGRLAV